MRSWSCVGKLLSLHACIYHTYMLKTSDFGKICYKTSTQGHSNQPIFNFIQSIIIIIIIIIIIMW